MYLVEFAKPTASASFAKLPRRIQRALDAAFDSLAQDPRSPRSGLDTHQLAGHQNLWTLRIGPRRGIYMLGGNSVVFGHRSTVYAWLHQLLPPEGRYIAPTRDVDRRGRGRARARR